MPEKNGEGLLTFEAAERILFSSAQSLAMPIELCPLHECSGRTLAKDIESSIDQPAADNSVIDFNRSFSYYLHYCVLSHLERFQAA